MAEQEFEVVAKLRIRQAKLEDAKDLQAYCFPDQQLKAVTESLVHDLDQEKDKSIVRLVADASGYAVGQIRIERKSSEDSVPAGIGYKGSKEEGMVEFCKIPKILCPVFSSFVYLAPKV